MTETLEKDVLSYGLLIGIAYQLYQTLVSIVPQVQTELALANMLITITVFFLYVLAQRKGAHPLLLLVLHVAALTGLTYFWKNYGGMSGTVPSFLCVYTSFIVVTSHGATRRLVIGLLAAMLVIYFIFPELLGMSSPFEPHRINLAQRNIDYVVVGGLIVAFTLYMKRKFIYYRDRGARRFRQLNQIARTLHHQNQELGMRQEETRAINDNLEALVENRAREAEEKNRELSEYAFINAHMLRGPLCRIMGLVHLMEKEPAQFSPEQIAELKAITREIDQRVKEINTVIS